jgi:hypothetical protein
VEHAETLVAAHRLIRATDAVRLTAELHHYGFSPRDIARLLEVSRDTVRARLIEWNRRVRDPAESNPCATERMARTSATTPD